VKVSQLSIAPVKGMALLYSDEVRLEGHGVTENRRFHLVDESGRRYGQTRRGLRNGKYIDFGVAGSVEQPGLVRVGDPVEPL
jgi:uncharacterized protein YcbX